VIGNRRMIYDFVIPLHSHYDYQFSFLTLFLTQG
jgi:hypothetical protein